MGHSEADKEIIKRVGVIAQKLDWTMTQVALAWNTETVRFVTFGLK
jgi:aryl-alcohol dehydrogenase-like predicted oxidoreductase